MSEVITSGQVIQKPDVVLEIGDFVPPGVIGVRNKTLEEAGYPTESASDSISPLEEDNLDGVIYDVLPVPQDMTVVSQTIRVGPDGKMVVDVVIESTELPGIAEFEARIVRAA